MRLLCLFLLLLITAACAPVAFTQQLDISGIQMGMSLDQAKAKIGPGYAYTPQKVHDPMANVQVATRSGDAWVFEAVGGKLVYAEHHVVFTPQARPSSQDTYSRLVQKYGPVSHNRDNSNWAFTPSGTLIRTSPAVRLCTDVWRSGRAPFDIAGPFQRRLSVPNSVPPDCGISISANAGGETSQVLLDEFDISIADLRALNEEAEHLAATKQQQQTDILNKAKQNKAPF